MEQHTSLHDEAPQGASFDYSFVDTVGRIALYDDLRSAPRVVEIKPADTAAYIEALASTVYEQSHGAGGTIPYTVIREVSENFIHARFKRGSGLHSRQREHHPLRRSWPRHPLERKGPNARVFFCRRADEKLYSGRRVGPPHCAGVPRIVPWHHYHRGQSGNRRRRHRQFGA